MAMNISDDGVAITKRFFEAIDALIASKRIRGIKTFTDEYGINRWNLIHVKDVPEKAVLKPELIAILVKDFNVSAEWLLVGRGQMFTI